LIASAFFLGMAVAPLRLAPQWREQRGETMHWIDPAQLPQTKGVVERFLLNPVWSKN
jgi:hypothetical protein